MFHMHVDKKVELNLSFKRTFTQGVEEVLVHNFIKERGYNLCQLEFSLDHWGESVVLSGLWSPDSVGSYRVANIY